MNQVVENGFLIVLVFAFAAWSVWVARRGSWQGRPVSKRLRQFLVFFGIFCAAFAVFLALLTFGLVPLP